MEFIEKFKTEKDWMEHFSKSQSLRKKYPDRIPVIVDRINTQTPLLKNHKFLVPTDLTVGQFLNIVRKNMDTLKPEQALFMFFGDANEENNKTLAPTGALMSRVYADHQDRSGFLIATVCVESTFGGY